MNLYPVPTDIFGNPHVDLAAAIASYSADRIGEAGCIRKPFRMDGADWVCVSKAGGATHYNSVRIYRLTLAAHFGGVTKTYADATRDDPNGFYHGITVRSGGQTFVITGPQYELLAQPIAIQESEDEEEEEEDADLVDEDEDEDEDEEEVPNCLCAKPLDKTDNYYETPCGYMCDDCAFAHSQTCAACAALFGYPLEDIDPPTCLTEADQGRADRFESRRAALLDEQAQPVQLDMFHSL